MTIMLGRLYAALKAAGTPEAEAMAAAEEMGDFREEFAGLRGEMAEVKGEVSGLRTDVGKLTVGLTDLGSQVGNLRAEVSFLRGRFDVLIWAVGINAAATIAILGVLLHR